MSRCSVVVVVFCAYTGLWRLKTFHKPFDEHLFLCCFFVRFIHFCGWSCCVGAEEWKNTGRLVHPSHLAIVSFGWLVCFWRCCCCVSSTGRFTQMISRNVLFVLRLPHFSFKLFLAHYFWEHLEVSIARRIAAAAVTQNCLIIIHTMPAHRTDTYITALINI